MGGHKATRTEIEADLAEINRILDQIRSRLVELSDPEPEPAPPDQPDLLTLAEVAEKIRMSVSFVKKLVASGDLTVERFGSRVLVPGEAVDAYRNANRQVSLWPAAKRSPSSAVFLVRDPSHRKRTAAGSGS